MNDGHGPVRVHYGVLFACATSQLCCRLVPGSFQVILIALVRSFSLLQLIFHLASFSDLDHIAPDLRFQSMLAVLPDRI